MTRTHHYRPKQEFIALVSEASRQSEYTSQAEANALTPVTEQTFLEQAIKDKFKSLTSASGELSMPCVPAMLGEHFRQIEGLLLALGQNLTPNEIRSLRQAIARRVTEGFQASPYARLVFRYGPPDPTVGLTNGLKVSTTYEVKSVEEKYDGWVKTRSGPLFGSHPDAKVMAIAATLGSPTLAPILDVGAGPGRNTLPLARRGHPVHAIELTPVFANQLLTAAREEGLPVTVTQSNILENRLLLPEAEYKLAIVVEVISHFRELNQVRQLLAKMCETVQRGGLLLFNCFLAVDGYSPDDAVREMGQVMWSYLLTRKELWSAMEGLPLEIVSDESALEYERSHLPPEAWPPTWWFISWASGRNIFPVVEETPPVELRWILARRK